MLEGFIIVIATIISISASLVSRRFHVLALSLLCHSMFIYYWFTSGEVTALYMTLAAFTGTFIQLATPEKYLSITVHVRVLFIVLLGAVCFKISYVNPADILAFFGFLNSRLSETFRRSINIQIGYIFSSILWLSFSLAGGDFVTILSFIVLFMAQVTALLFKLDFVEKMYQLLRLDRNNSI